jgi:outer membrane scaffolding protein for murein synthesis (MipA/OmpV family)
MQVGMTQHVRDDFEFCHSMSTGAFQSPMNRDLRPRRVPSRTTRSALAIASACALATAAAADEKRNWDLELGVGAAYAPDYRGASAARSGLRIWADGAYRTEGFGTIALDSGALTIAPEVRWDFVDSPNAGIGVLIGYRTGRNDRNPGFASASDGSARLRGLQNMSGAVDAGVSGRTTVLGVPLFGQLRMALNGPQGALANLGIYLPVKPTSDLELTILPTVTWANARQMRAVYGVSRTAATASGFASYDPGAGWENAAIEVGGDWRVSDRWHLVASLAHLRLLGKPARSPIVQDATQSSALAGLVLHF